MFYSKFDGLYKTHKSDFTFQIIYNANFKFSLLYNRTQMYKINAFLLSGRNYGIINNS